MKRVLCMWLPNWPVQRLVVARPELSSHTILIYARQENSIQRVIACSPAARAIGVSGGMPLTEATALVRGPRAQDTANLRSNSAAFRPQVFHTALYDPEADEQELTRLADWCEKFSPIVGVEQTAATSPGDKLKSEKREPESLFLDVTGLAPLFGGEEALARKVVAEMAERGYVARAAIADSIGAAWAGSRFAPFSCSAQAGREDGVWVIAAGQAAAALAPLPLEALRLPAATIAMLQTLGIARIEQLLRLPRASLSSRFGDGLLLRMDQAWGTVREPIAAHRPSPEFQAVWVLEYAADRRDAVEFVVRQLIVRVAHLLAEQNRGAVRLEVRLECIPVVSAASAEREKHTPVFCVNLFRPTASPQHLWELVRLQFDQMTLPGPVQKAVVHATLTGTRETRQGELFEDLQGDLVQGDLLEGTQPQLVLLIERLSSRLGPQQVLRPRLVADAQPERACRYVPLTGRKPRGRKVKGAGCGKPAGAFGWAVNDSSRVAFHPVDRPLQLLHPPLALSVIAAVPDGPPARFRHLHRWHTIVRHWGPERIETGWWRGPTLRRDYYRVETEAGLWFWLFRRLEDGRWFLHGAFV